MACWKLRIPHYPNNNNYYYKQFFSEHHFKIITNFFLQFHDCKSTAPLKTIKRTPNKAISCPLNKYVNQIQCWYNHVPSSVVPFSIINRPGTIFCFLATRTKFLYKCQQSYFVKQIEKIVVIFHCFMKHALE